MHKLKDIAVTGYPYCRCHWPKDWIHICSTLSQYQSKGKIWKYSTSLEATTSSLQTPDLRHGKWQNFHCIVCDAMTMSPRILTKTNRWITIQLQDKRCLWCCFFGAKKKQEIDGGELVLFQLKSKSPRRKLCHSMEEIYTFKGIVVQKVVGLKSPYHWEIIHFANCYPNTIISSAVAVYVWCPVYILSGFFSSTYTSNPKQLSIHIIGIFDLPFKFHKIPWQFSKEKSDSVPYFCFTQKKPSLFQSRLFDVRNFVYLRPVMRSCRRFPQDLMAHQADLKATKLIWECFLLHKTGWESQSCHDHFHLWPSNFEGPKVGNPAGVVGAASPWTSLVLQHWTFKLKMMRNS